MDNYELAPDEVILFDDDVSRDDFNERLHLTLTSKKMIFEQTITKGFFKPQTEPKLIDTIMLDSIKIYNGSVQVQTKRSDVYIQTTENNFIIMFDSKIEAMKFTNKIIDTLTGTTMSKRGADKVRDMMSTVDDVLGFYTRDTIKGVLENGIAGTLLRGIKKTKK